MAAPLAASGRSASPWPPSVCVSSTCIKREIKEGRNVVIKWTAPLQCSAPARLHEDRAVFLSKSENDTSFCNEQNSSCRVCSLPVQTFSEQLALRMLYLSNLCR